MATIVPRIRRQTKECVYIKVYTFIKKEGYRFPVLEIIGNATIDKATLKIRFLPTSDKYRSWRKVSKKRIYDKYIQDLRYYKAHSRTRLNGK